MSFDLGDERLYASPPHRLRARRSLLVCNVLGIRDPAIRSIDSYIDRTFAYVDATEPLSVYEPRLR